MALRGIRTEHGLEGGELEALLGDRAALDRLFSATYEELRRLASSVRRSDANVAESAELLGVSETTILRDWRASKAWLAHQLRQAS